ncbi:MAG: 50S ribosomal protein L29 [Campylobacterales bacterium]
MKYTEIAELGASELQEKLGEKKKELFELKLKLKTMQLQNTSELRSTRRDIAKLKTAFSAQKGAK